MSRIAPLLVALVLASACGDDSAVAAGQRSVSWLAAGDSFSSAEGIPGAQGDCARSQMAYAPLARDELADELDITEFALVACTAAKLHHFDDQLAEALEGRTDDRRFELVTITLAGNDAGFEAVLFDCLGLELNEAAQTVLSALLGTAGAECDVGRDELIERVESLEPRLVDLYRRLSDDVVTADGAVIVLGYSHLWADPEGWASDPADRCEGMRAEDVETVRAVVARLNETMERATRAVDRVSFLDVRGIFDGHELCDDDEYMNGLIAGVANRTFRVQGSYHPNAAGQRAMADLLVDEIRRIWELE